MSLIPFFKNFIGAKGHAAAENVVKAMVALDPEAATRADLLSMEQDLDRAGTMIAKLRADLSHEQTEYDALKRQYGELMGAAEVLQRRSAAAPDDTSIKASLASLLDRIEHMVPELDREKHDVESTQSLLTEAEATYQDKAQALASAKANLDRARHDLARAGLEEQRANERAEQAKAVAGLKSSGASGLTIALDTMKASADEARQRADAATMKAQALTNVKDAKTDANVASALAEAKGAAPAQSLSDRLAALKR